jgi:hypothetical protein
VKTALRLSLMGAALAVAGCAVGPDYKKPTPDLPVAWTLEAPWRTGVPADTADKGDWWKAFGDPELDALEQRAMADSPTLAIAAARLAQARTTVTAQSAGLFPSLSLGSHDQRFRITANRPLSNYAVPNASTVQNDFPISLSASYEVDLAGRVSRSSRPPTWRTRAWSSAPNSPRTGTAWSRSTPRWTCWTTRSRCSAGRWTSSSSATTWAPAAAWRWPSNRPCSTVPSPRLTCKSASAPSSSTRSRR